jgi:hypothetical protein
MSAHDPGLQFGHGGDAVEHEFWEIDPQHMWLRLQFGHGGDAVEHPPGCTMTEFGTNPLHFGHGGDAVEHDRLPGQQVNVAGGASIRPRR